MRGFARIRKRIMSELALAFVMRRRGGADFSALKKITEVWDLFYCCVTWLNDERRFQSVGEGIVLLVAESVLQYIASSCVYHHAKQRLKNCCSLMHPHGTGLLCVCIIDAVGIIWIKNSEFYRFTAKTNLDAVFKNLCIILDFKVDGFPAMYQNCAIISCAEQCIQASHLGPVGICRHELVCGTELPV